MKRLLRSCKAYNMDPGYSVDELIEATKELLRANELESGYIRPIIFLGLGALGLNPPVPTCRRPSSHGAGVPISVRTVCSAASGPRCLPAPFLA